MNNCHVHLLTQDDVCERFLPLNLVDVLRTKVGFSIANTLKYVVPNDEYERYLRFAQYFRKTSEDIFNELQLFYPKNTCFWVITINQQHMGGGKTGRSYTEQVKEIFQLSEKYENIKVIIHIDPRDTNLSKNFYQYINHPKLIGIKIYPPMGYYPYDRRLMPIYEVCEKHNLQVWGHCSPNNPVRWKGSKKELLELLNKPQSQTKGKNIKSLCNIFTHPRNWESLLKEFTGINFCLCHFGSREHWQYFMDGSVSADNWFIIIKDMLREYPNCYADISMTLYKQEFIPLLSVLLEDPVLQKKILFGDDFFMNETISTTRWWSINMRHQLGEYKWKLITEHNPSAFLAGAKR